MAWIRQIEINEAEGKLSTHYKAALKRAGRVYGIVKLHSLDVDFLAASMRIYKSTTVAEDKPLDRWVREAIAVVTSRTNECFY
jgi:hypothetical protein